MRNARTGKLKSTSSLVHGKGSRSADDPADRGFVSRWARPGLIAACIVVATSACSTHKVLKISETPTPTPAARDVQANEAPAATVVTAEPATQAEQPVQQAAAEPPKPATAPRDVAMQTPVPQEKPEATTGVVDVVTVTEKPAETTETVEVVETDREVVASVETTTTSETVVDRVEIDQASGRIKEDVEVIETTQTATDTVIVDKATGDTMETVEVGKPRRRVVRSLQVEFVPGSPRDPRRLFAGPEQFPANQYAAYAVVAIRADAPASDRRRIKMICDAFIASQAAEADSATQKPSDQMVTIWPVSSTDRATDLNRAPRNQVCQEAVDRYGLAMGHRAILDTEKTGWILDNPGPYLLAWAPGSVKGNLDASILLLDLSGVTDPGQAVELMTDWSDIERDRDIWTEGGWDTEALQSLVGRWETKHGRRRLMLLGPVVSSQERLIRTPTQASLRRS